MEGLVNKLMSISVVVVLGLMLQYPKTWKVELAKLQYKILKDVGKTSNWGCPSIWGKKGCGDYDPKRY